MWAHTYRGIKKELVWATDKRLRVISNRMLLKQFRDNYNSLTSAKLPPKNGNGQLKSVCVDKKADKINIATD